MDEPNSVDIENNPGVTHIVLPEEKYEELLDAVMLQSNDQPGLRDLLESNNNKCNNKGSNLFNFQMKNKVLENLKSVESNGYIINEIGLENSYSLPETDFENDISLSMIVNDSIPFNQINQTHETKNKNAVLTIEIEQPVSSDNDTYHCETQSQTSKYEVSILNNCFDETDKFPCKICKTHHVYTSAELIEHYNINHRKMKSPFECFFPDCGMFFKSNYKLDRHLKTHAKVKKKKYKCDFENCNKTFTENYMLNRHKQDHELRTCKKCNLSFSSKHSMKKHMKEVHAIVEKLFVCEICQKNLLSLSAYNKHILSHKNGKTHYCKICNKHFKSSYQLKSHHSHNHTTHRPFKCDQCSKCYAQQADLNRHKKTHEEKPLECNICENKMFIRNEQLVSHLKCVHVTENMTSHEIEKFVKDQLSKSTGSQKQYFQCKHMGCMEGFLSFHGFKAHMKKAHDISNVSNYQLSTLEKLTVSKYVVPENNKILNKSKITKLSKLEKQLSSNISNPKKPSNEKKSFKKNESVINKDTNKKFLDSSKKSLSMTSNRKRNHENSHFTFKVACQDTSNKQIYYPYLKSTTPKISSTAIKPTIYKSSNSTSSTNCDQFLTNAFNSHAIETSTNAAYSQASSLSLFENGSDSLFSCLSNNNSFGKGSGKEKMHMKQYDQPKVHENTTEGLGLDNVQFEKSNEINEYIEPFYNYIEDNLGNEFLLEGNEIDVPISTIESLISSNSNSANMDSTNMLLENRSETEFDNGYRTVSPNEFYLK